MSGNFSLMWAVLGLPAVAFVLLALYGRALAKGLGKPIVSLIAVAPIFGAFAIAAKATLDLQALDAAHRSIVVKGFPWIDTATLKLPFELVIDPLSMTMALIITGIGGLIFLYSTGYMSEEKEYSRFFAYLNLFVVSMLILVLGNNLAMLFMGWEGVGLCSYLLIGFWYEDLANARAANKAFVVNRVGDWGLGLGLASIVAFLVQHHANVADARFLSYDAILPQLYKLYMLHPTDATITAILLFIGAAGKSAQFPLYLWLPDAMAGPTPVSALIHAATMVTSGVVLLNRMHVVFEATPVASGIIAVIGAFTALFAAVIAFGQTDIKKVLAYSTVSQLGFMFIACGTGNYWAGMFHVTTHAFFKALLFLGAGAVIHAMSHNQDLRNYGKLSKYLPITTWTMVIGWLAIAAVAIPMGDKVLGFSGAYSKEAILTGAIGGQFAVINDFNVGLIAGYVGLGVAVLTSIYMTRLTLLTFFGKEERWRAIPSNHDEHHHSDMYTEPESEPGAPLWQPEGLPKWDPHGFFYERPVRYAGEGDHAHELTAEHTPKEVPASMWFPLVVLAALSVAGGFLMAKDDAFKTWLYPNGLRLVEEAHEVPNLGLYSAIAAVGGILMGLVFYGKGLPKDQGFDEKDWRPWRLSARNQFGFDDAMTVNAVSGGGDLARGIWRFIDIGFVDGIVNGFGNLAAWLSGLIRIAQTGYVRLYALIMLVGGIGLLGYLLMVVKQIGGTK